MRNSKKEEKKINTKVLYNRVSNGLEISFLLSKFEIHQFFEFAFKIK